MTQIEKDTMRAIISLSKEYCKQNMFVELKGYFSSDEYERKIELLVKLKDVTGAANIGGMIGVRINTYNYSFVITEEEYKEKLQKHIKLAV